MKRVVSLSLGTSARDHEVQIQLCGQEVLVRRIGVDGDHRRALAMLQELDGQVDAIGLGGTNMTLGDGKFKLMSGQSLARTVRSTPVVDGSAIKATLELSALELLRDAGYGPDSRVLFVMGIERPALARAFVEAGYRMVFGDVAFALGIPVRLTSLRQVHLVAAALMPVLSYVPIHWLYPVGSQQDSERPNTFRRRYYREADVIAGDWQYVKRYLPLDLEGKVVLSQSITGADLDMLRDRNCKMLIGTTPMLGGRIFATNCVQAILVALSGRRPEQLALEDYKQLVEDAGLKPYSLTF